MASTINATPTSSGLISTADNSGVLALQTGGTTAVTVDGSQNVGIGTTTVSNPNGFSKAVNIVGGGAGTAGGALYVGNTTNLGVVGYYNSDMSINNIAAGNIVFYTNANTERMRITSAGSLLVGTTTVNGRVTSDSSGGGTNTAYWGKNTAGASAATMVAWNSSDTGNNYLHAFFTDTGANNVGNIDYLRSAGLVRYNTTSDATLKNIIGDSDKQKSVDILKSTRIREFAWKNDTEQKPQIGVIAQELYETYKGAVSVGGENEENEYRPWGVDKTAFTFHLIAGWQAHEKLIQELNAKVDAQATIIAELQARNT